MGNAKPSTLIKYSQSHRIENGDTFPSEEAALQVLEKRLLKQSEILYRDFFRKNDGLDEKVGSPMDAFEMANEIEALGDYTKLNLTSEEMKVLSENEMFMKSRDKVKLPTVPPKKRYFAVAYALFTIAIFTFSPTAGVIILLLPFVFLLSLLNNPVARGELQKYECFKIPEPPCELVKPSVLISRRLEVCKLLCRLEFDSGETKRCFKTLYKSEGAQMVALNVGLSQCLDAENIFCENLLTLQMSDNVMSNDPFGATKRINDFADKQLYSRMKVIKRIVETLIPGCQLKRGVEPEIKGLDGKEAEEMIIASGAKLSVLSRLSDKMSRDLTVIHKNCRMKSRDKIVLKSKNKRVMDTLGVRLAVHSSRFTNVLLSSINAWLTLSEEDESILFTRLKINFSETSSWADVKINVILRCGARLELQVVPITNLMTDLDVDGHRKHDQNYV
jgi:hypothetical protein